MEIKGCHNLNLFWKVDMKYIFDQICNSLQKRNLFYGVKTNSTDLVSNLNLIQKKLNWKYKIWIWFGNGPWPIGLAQPTRLGLTQPVSIWVGQTDPDLPRILTSLPLSSPTNPSRHRRRPAIPASSGSFRHRHPRQSKRPSALYLLHQVDWKDASSQTISWLFPTRVLPAPVASELDALHDSFVVLDVRVCGGGGVCAAPVEVPMMRCSRCCHGEVTLDCTWPAARALPRHAFQASAWAIGECLPLLLLPFSSLAAVTGHLGHDWLRQAHRLASVMLLAAACLMFEFS
jgi:hypothetical protein